MSVQALNHVRKLRAGGFAQGVLLYLAMCHNGETGQCNPTRENIREFFSCDVKRVDRALSALKQAGLIVSIKKPSREGVSNWYVFPNLEGSPQNGIDPKTVGTPQNGERVAPKTGATGSPQNGEGKSNKKSKEKEVSAPSAEVAPKAKKVRNSFVTASKPDDVPQALWDDFITHRRAKKAPVTETVISRTRSQAQKCGMTLAEALEMTVARGWQGFEARYVKDEEKPAHNPYRVKAPVEPQEPPRRNPFLVSNTTRPAPQSKTPEQIEEERSFDLFCRVMDGKFEGGQDDPFA